MAIIVPGSGIKPGAPANVHVTKGMWARAFLMGLPAPPTKENLIAVVAWIDGEGTQCPWNPLATVWRGNGAFPCTFVTSQYLAAYHTMADGLAGTRSFLRLYAFRYGPILAKLLTGTSSADSIVASISSSGGGWGVSSATVAAVRGRYPAVLSEPLKAAAGTIPASSVPGNAAQARLYQLCPQCKGGTGFFSKACADCAKAHGISIKGGTGNPLSSIGDLIAWITNTHNWLRLGEILGGAALILIGALAAGKVFGGGAQEAIAPLADALKTSKGGVGVFTPEKRLARVERREDSRSRRKTASLMLKDRRVAKKRGRESTDETIERHEAHREVDREYDLEKARQRRAEKRGRVKSSA